MNLQILISKKGTKVVTASNLHAILQLADHHYGMNVRKWLDDVYAFHDGIRKPIKMQDFAQRKIKDNPVFKDYYLSVELAKLITLNSRSKLKQKYARILLEAEREEERVDELTKEQVETVLDLTKAMSRLSCQEASEQRHLAVYEQRNGGTAANWWKYRASILGYSPEKLKREFEKIGKELKGKTQRQMLLQIDRYELIRTGIIDLFLGMGKSAEYARTMGDLAKRFASEMKLEVVDDKKSTNLFASQVKPEIIHHLQNVPQRIRV